MNKILSLLVIVAALGCGQAKQSADKKETKQPDIFPITSFIEGQIHQVDSFQLPTVKYITVNGKSDSSLISLNEFRAMAQEFVRPDINSPDVSKWYKENNFADQTIKAVTLNYTTDNKNLEIQRVDVVISASAVVNDKVRSIFMEKQRMSNDTAILKKLYWRTDKNFQIITSKQIGNQPESISIIKVEWDK